MISLPAVLDQMEAASYTLQGKQRANLV